MRADVERQYDRYNELWKAHGDLLIEAQTLHSQVPIRSSSVEQKARAVYPEAQAIGPKVRGSAGELKWSDSEHQWLSWEVRGWFESQGSRRRQS